MEDPSSTNARACPGVPVEASSQPELVRLRDGSQAAIRATRPNDEPSLHVFLNDLCPEARRLRFFSGAVDTGRAAHSAVDPVPGHYGLVAHDALGAIVGHATFTQLDTTHAEVAVEVADHLHGRGLGTLLVKRLAEVAEQRGITHFEAEVLCENHAMLDVFREGFDARAVRREGPEERVELLTSGWRLARERFASNAR